jgi:hypothetical protein
MSKLNSKEALNKLTQAILDRDKILAFDLFETHKDHVDLNKVVTFKDDYGEIQRSTLLEMTIVLLPELAMRLLDIPDINHNVIYGSDHTPFIVACMYKREEIALKMLEFDDVDYNNVDEEGESTGFLLACQYKMEKLASKLLEKDDLDIDKINGDDETAFYWACYNKLVFVAEQIPDCADTHGWPATNKHREWFKKVKENIKNIQKDIVIQI